MNDELQAGERVVVYTRAGCHLCAEAEEVVARVCAATGSGWMTIDVDTSPELAGRYGEYVPVVMVDGVQQGFWRIDEARLTRLLTP
ncbi:Glutaredoxin-like domain [Sanguibacter gelidistatuariae]|uniref:Glutaredoxin-like domain n=1 Tax=Sanguibacter gelidistatuariae TaxID=1814289 RepID=A0A1G6X487_9MICO|nr:glutaredoxin family protein [Sanguibacter gelidistatuariae]SDD72911.1 Glutaredoxin-like domain [Sanguibacter gelidistatuariae]